MMPIHDKPCVRAVLYTETDTLLNALGWTALGYIGLLQSRELRQQHICCGSVVQTPVCTWNAVFLS